ncbi:relaxin receptor 1-like [Uloborus diversus]|uniref:relaxin receptor 1-like n=1 Tax=Uloborus diversus TaxID=327109 RepID=UPI002409E42A|nr:relaxin receptor 1-like [Uloborus diversus]
MVLPASGSKAVQSPPHLVRAPCPTGYFPCNSSEVCVDRRVNCDGRFDCPDQSDEWACEDHNRKNYFDQMFKKRPDADREQKVAGCELRTTPEECSCSNTSLYCNHRSLRNVPHMLPQNVQELDLSGNKLHVLHKSDFSELHLLHTLILTSSEVTILRPEALANLSNLKKLYLTSNRMSVIDNGTFSSNINLKLLVISHNPLNSLSPAAFSNLINLEELDLRDCGLRSLPFRLFDDLWNLRVLWLEGNHLEFLPEHIFQNLNKLQVMSLSRNRLTAIDSYTFHGLQNLTTLAIARNNLNFLNAFAFENLTSLLKLDLHGNDIRSIDRQAFSWMPKLESLNLRKNSLKSLQIGTFDDLRQLKHIYFDEFHLCSLALHVRICEPRGDGISSIAHLLDSVVLRVSVWGVAVVAGLGNLAVLVGRLLLAEPNEVHSFYIKNLSLADLLMAAYLFVIAAYDLRFRGEYIHHEARWRHSWQCNLCGFLSTLSSESSVLILTIITVDRYTSILYPLSLKRRTICSASIAMGAVWSLAILLSALPLLNIEYYGTEFYGNNGVCLPLQIHDPFGQAWEYSTFLFCGLNLAAFLFILFAYLSMFFTISHSKIGLRSTQQLQDRTIAKRFAFIVGTDFLCWVPIVLIKVIAMAGVEIQKDLYAWVAVFLLPVNSALNPVLYTLTTKLFKQHLAKIVYSCRGPAAHNDSNSGISLNSILQHRNSKRTIVTTFSEKDPCSSNRTSLFVPDSPASLRLSALSSKKKDSFSREDML